MGLRQFQWCAWWMSWSLSGGLWAQTGRQPEYKIKAKFLIFIGQAASRSDTTPLTSSREAFRIGLVGDNPFETYLAEVISRRTIGGRPVQLVDARTSAEARSCHLLFVSRSDPSRYRGVMEWIKGMPIIMVGDSLEFLDQGGTVAFRVAEERVEIWVDLASAKSAGLLFDPSFLSLVKLRKNKAAQ